MGVAANFKDRLVRGLVAGLGRAAFARHMQADATSDLAQKGAVAGGSEIVVVQTGGATRKLRKQPNVQALRAYAEGSTWVRAAIDIYRNVVGRAESKLVPANKDQRGNRQVEQRLRKLLNQPNPSGDPYTLLKEKAIEDYLVLGHYAIEKALSNGAYPLALYTIDAAHFAFVSGWTGKERPAVARYALLKHTGGVARWLANEQAMALVNRARSYTDLGLSHVETLHKTLLVLLGAEDFFLEQLLEPSTQGVLNLGPGFKPEQLSSLRAELQELKKAFAIISAPTDLSYVDFRMTEQHLRLLDTSTFFVRQVAAIFGLSTAKLRLAVDTSRANTQAMFDDDLEGCAALLSRIEQLENQDLLGAFGPVEETNLKIEYPILSQRDEQRQAVISKMQVGGGAWVSANEARADTGKEQLKLPIANQVLVAANGSLVPLEALNARFYNPDGTLKESAVAPPPDALANKPEPPRHAKTTEAEDAT
jgi:hypothetical protein